MTPVQLPEVPARGVKSSPTYTLPAWWAEIIEAELTARLTQPEQNSGR
jgi:hypothetical protein